MKILILWGFEGNAELLKAETSRIRAGQTFDDVDEEYAHQLIGKGLAEEVGGKQAAPKTTKPAKPDENKGGKADKADADAKKDGEGA